MRLKDRIAEGMRLAREREEPVPARPYYDNDRRVRVIGLANEDWVRLGVHHHDFDGRVVVFNDDMVASGQVVRGEGLLAGRLLIRLESDLEYSDTQEPLYVRRPTR